MPFFSECIELIIIARLMNQSGIIHVFILPDTDEYVKKNCATLIREIAKHTPEVRFRSDLGPGPFLVQSNAT